jgi:hypothetical protein
MVPELGAFDDVYPSMSSQARDGTATAPQEPATDSMGFLLPSSYDLLSKVLSWESDFGSTNPFAGEDVNGSSSPVSVIASLRTRSCAWCGLGGNNAKAVKLMVCSACQSTYYCSSHCQSKDRINGHAMICQLVTVAD